MNYKHTRLAAALMAAALSLVPVAGASARGGFTGGGFRSSSVRSFSSSRSAGSSFRSLRAWGSATKPKASVAPAAAAPSIGSGPSSAFSSRRTISGARSSVSVQRGLYDSAKRNGTLFSSQAEAATSFRGRYGKDYGSTFASEPAARPSYIPSSTYVGGRNVTVVYNQGLGGYGYMHPTLGTWMLYDAISDAAMAHTIMGSRGYYYGSAPVYVSHGPSFLGLALAILLLLIVAAVVASAIARRRSAAWEDQRDTARRDWRAGGGSR